MKISRDNNSFIKIGVIKIKKFKVDKNIIVPIIIVVMILMFFYIKNKSNQEVNLDELSLNNENIESQVEDEINDSGVEEDMIMIHIVGAINQEGIVELEEGKRIVDAIEAAGGAKENADLSKINLAYELEDGEKIRIPTIGENIENNEYIINESENTNISKKDNEKININKATQNELEEISGIGPSTALKIIEYREENGKYKSIEDVKNVSGIGDSKYEAIKEYICVK